MGVAGATSAARAVLGFVTAAAPGAASGTAGCAVGVVSTASPDLSAWLSVSRFPLAMRAATSSLVDDALENRVENVRFAVEDELRPPSLMDSVGGRPKRYPKDR